MLRHENWNKFQDTIRNKDEFPNQFFERLCENTRYFMGLDPLNLRDDHIVRDVLVSQSFSVIRDYFLKQRPVWHGKDICEL